MNTGTKRTAYLPDVPTVIESSIKDYDVASWNGLSVSAKTPQAIVATFNKAMKDVIPAPRNPGRGLGAAGAAGAITRATGFIGSAIVQGARAIGANDEAGRAEPRYGVIDNDGQIPQHGSQRSIIDGLVRRSASGAHAE